MLTSLGRAVHWKSKVVACGLIDKIQNKAQSTFYLNKKPYPAIIGPQIQTVIYTLFSFSFYAWQSKELPRETYEQRGLNIEWTVCNCSPISIMLWPSRSKIHCGNSRFDCSLTWPPQHDKKSRKGAETPNFNIDITCQMCLKSSPFSS